MSSFEIVLIRLYLEEGGEITKCKDNKDGSISRWRWNNVQ